MSNAARAALAGVLVLFVAVTPLSAVLSPGHFETDMRRDDGSFHVVLDDQTGLVAALAPGDGVSESSPRALHVQLDGACGEWDYQLRFYASDGGFTIDRQKTSGGCNLLYLVSQDVVLALRAPVDPATVAIVDVPRT